MNWDESSYEYAEARSSEYFGHLPERMFEHGAKWQRDQLRTDEAIERVAVELAERHDKVPFDQMPEFIQNAWREDARACVSALLGEQ